MEILRTVEEVKSFVKKCKGEQKTIGFVPTMGALHQGHLTLGKTAKEHSDVVIYSIFVNPTQFGPNEDLAKYPRDFEGDRAKLGSIGVDAVFYPEEKTLYPDCYKTYVSVEGLSSLLCGQTRLNHFRGVATVVLKLFNIVECDKAFFGKKDMQQFLILEQMVRDLNLNTKLYGVDIVRESDGLAMSSRNAYLSEAERQAAPVLFRSLSFAKEHKNSFKSTKELVEKVKELISAQPLARIEYVEIYSRQLQPLESLEEPCVIFLAVRFGVTRLIDNMEL